MKKFVPWRNLTFLAVIASLYIPGVSGQSIFTDSVIVHPFGKVFIYSPESRTGNNLIIMISGDGGWKSGVPEFAREFARSGALVAGVDILRYYNHLKQLGTECYHVFSDFVELATAVERKYQFPGYTPPVLVGYSSGATLVYGILTQARPGTFVGGISLGFCPDIDLPKRLCETNGLKEKVLKPDKSFLLLPDPMLQDPWIVLQGKIDKVCDFETVNDFILHTGNARLISLDKVGHGFSKWNNFMPQLKSAYIDLITNYEKEISNHTRPGGFTNPSNLPLRLIREKPGTENNLITVMFSGDGGWYGFEELLCDHLGTYGIPVIGIDTKKYLWTRKTPEETAKDVGDLLRYYCDELGKSRIMLFGYSQGAEILPFVYQQLPADIKDKIKSIIMLSPDPNTDFEIHISNMLGLGNRRNTFEVVPEIKKNNEVRQVIVLGAEEKTEIPGLLQNTGVEFIMVPGDHHYSGNAGLIIDRLKDLRIF